MNFFDKITGAERLQKIDRVLQKKILESKGEEEKKLIAKRKQVQKRLAQIEKKKRAAAAVTGGLCILLFCGGVSLLMKDSGNKNKDEQQKATQTMAETEQTESETQDQTPDVELTLTFTGDCTLGTDESFNWSTGFSAYYEMNGGEYFLRNVRDIFEKDDLTIVNLEGTFTEETTREPKLFAFKGKPEFVDILTSSSVEAANLANNHSHDYGEKSYQDTIQTLQENQVQSFGYDRTALVEVQGVKIGLFGIYELADHLERIPQVKSCITSLKEQGAEIIVAVFHWSNELVTVPDENQTTLAHLAIDEGADVVVGHHPHVLQGIGDYKGKTIAYSLGNFCFGGNTNPSDMDTILFQQKFTLNKAHEIIESSYEVIPCSISSETTYNNYQPRVLEGEEAERVLQKLKERTDQIIE